MVLSWKYQAWLRGQYELGAGLEGLHSSFFSSLHHQSDKLEHVGSPCGALFGATIMEKAEMYHPGMFLTRHAGKPLGPISLCALISLTANGRDRITHPFKPTRNPRYWQTHQPHSSLPVLCLFPAPSPLPADRELNELPCRVQAAAERTLVMARRTEMMRAAFDSSSSAQVHTRPVWLPSCLWGHFAL